MTDDGQLGGGTLPRRAEIVVVGAGLAGCAVAYQLAKRGREVVVVEQRGICSGASGRNGGMTGAGSALLTETGRAVYALTHENLRLLREELPAELGSDFSLRLPGTLDIATTEAQWAHLAESVAAQQALGVDVRLLDRDEVRQLVPVVSDHILGAKFAPGSGHLWPFDLVNRLADGARRLGARIVSWTPVERLITGHDGVAGVATSAGRIEAATVVLATNAWTSPLLTLPPGALVPARGQILVSQPVADILAHPFGTNFDKEYGRQTATGQILCGGFRRLDADEGLGHYEERVTPAVLSGIANCLTTIFPKLGALSWVRGWAGIMGFTADGLPLIGQYSPLGNLYVSAGYNGGGFSWGAAAGKALAALICDEEAGYNLEPFNPARFHEGGVRWANPFTAGERNNPRAAAADAVGAD